MQKQITNALRTFISDYGMIFVLFVLCILFSILTHREQNPRDTAAAKLLAIQIVSQHSESAKVLILTGDTYEAKEFSQAVARSLKDLNAEVVNIVNGTPVEMREALDAVVEKKIALNVVACDNQTATYSLIDKLGEKIPELSEVEVMIPQTYKYPDFLKVDNLRAVATRIAVIAIIAIGMTLVIITAGIDLSVGSLIALSAVTCALVIRANGAQNATIGAMLSGAAVTILLSAAVGMFSGVMVAWLRIPAFIVTLSVMQAASGVAYLLTESETINQIPESFTWLGRGLALGIPNSVILMILLYCIAHVMMTRTVLGRYIYSVGGNEEAARLSGVPVKSVLVFCYLVCGALAGLGGVIRASELKSGAPNFGQMAELEVIAAVVVGGASLAGGRGKIFGTLIGALIIGVMGNGMNLINIDSNAQKVVLGTVVLGAVLIDTLKTNDKVQRLAKRVSNYFIPPT
jgi:ribose transport system permease protein